MMPAHCRALMAEVPESVRRSNVTSCARTLNRLYPGLLDHAPALRGGQEPDGLHGLDAKRLDDRARAGQLVRWLGHGVEYSLRQIFVHVGSRAGEPAHAVLDETLVQRGVAQDECRVPARARVAGPAGEMATPRRAAASRMRRSISGAGAPWKPAVTFTMTCMPGHWNRPPP